MLKIQQFIPPTKNDIIETSEKALDMPTEVQFLRKGKVVKYD